MQVNKARAILRNTTIVLTLSFAAYGQSTVLITQPINEQQLFTLQGNTRPEAIAANDRGRVPDSMPIEHMLLQLQRSAAQEQAVDTLIDQLQDPASPNYHHWLTVSQFAEKFGLAQQDLNAISGWLRSQGFAVNAVYPSGMLVDFSGTAGQIRAAFHTEIHNLMVNGVPHIANMSDPQIPAALAPAVTGVVSLHNFSPQAMLQQRAEYTFPVGGGFSDYTVVPGDLATIYNLNALFTAGTTGTGQTVVVIEDSNLYKSADWTDFRKTFGLSKYTSGKLTTVHPPSTGTNNCANPGVNDAAIEATVDAEYASAAAPNATIEVASCADTTTTFGGLIAVENLVASATPPAIISMSYGLCEAENGASSNAAFKSAFQEAVAHGVSVFVAAGDAAAATCDRGASSATHGIGITGWGETPYNVAVGGTDFGDTYAGTNTTYWRAKNSATFESAKSYVPEIPWNDSCAGDLASTFLGYPAPYGTTGFCNSSFGANFLDTNGGGGGPSGCATGKPATAGVVGGTCKGYARPSWQAGVLGLPANKVRNVPDVSLFAADGVWSHYYILCFSDTALGGAPCTGAPDTWSGAGGTSFGAPIMAAIQALVNEVNGSPQGNPNVVYYKLAAAEYGASGDASCNSTLGNGVASTCTFYDITQGDMDVDCTGKIDCYLPSGTYGVLSTSDTSYAPAYKATTGWDFASGLGSVNANNLVTNWKTVAP
ncbi:MAG TPA: protease pro-enzyme activation domain-containing protein [Bryobacteraceae bacterium]|jgi:subtilase family serine protease|nr:protease pro-enzyme activation domain-containing protein [Bryobacteraceae bacterium]